MKNVLVIGIATLALVGCGKKNEITVEPVTSQVDCSKLDASSADYPESCKTSTPVNPSAEKKCQNDPCEGDEQPAQ